MSLTILSVAYPLTIVGPDACGGSEQILSLLDRALLENGHRSLVLASEGSKVKGELIPSPGAPPELDETVRRWGRRVHRQLLLDTLNHYEIDLVHMHSLDFHTYLPASSIPTLATLHLPVDWYPEHIFQAQRRSFFLNCVSSYQHAACPPCHALQPYIPNGIELDLFTCQDKKQPYVLGMGRICPEKGFHLALEAAEKAGVPMILAGELFPYGEHIAYFEKEIAPRLSKTRQYIGPVGQKKKRQLLSGARALLLPSLVAETSSLVTMEALASGTPVIAFPVGAVPELIQDSQNGYLVDGPKEMAKAIRSLDGIKPTSCRNTVARSCDYRNMTKRYLSMYSRIVKECKQKSPSVAPMGLSWLADVS